MTKKELVNALSEQADITLKASDAVYDKLVDIITGTLVSGEEVNLFGLGTFKTTKTAAKKGRNPATGETIQIPAGTRVSFKVSKTLKLAVK